MSVPFYRWAPGSFFSGSSICVQFDSRSSTLCSSDSFGNEWEWPVILAFATLDSNSPHFVQSLYMTCCKYWQLCCWKEITQGSFSLAPNWILWLIDWPAGPLVSWPLQEPARLMVWAAFHGALKHSDPSFVIWETLSSYVAHYLDGFRGWWVGRQAKAQLEDNVCRSKEPTRQRVHKMWIQFQGRIDDYGSRKPIKLIFILATSPIASLGPIPLQSILSFSRAPQGQNKAMKDALIPESRLQDGLNQRSTTTTESSSHSTPERIRLKLWFSGSGLASSTPLGP